MRANKNNTLTLAPTDLSNYLGCHHLTNLEKHAALGDGERPIRFSPVVEALQERGLAHEAAYKEHLVNSGRTVVDATDQNALALMKDGVDVIFQARLSDGTWSGVADFLVRVEAPSELGDWSYEAVDTKLAKETKGGTILQLSVYSFLLAELQGVSPEHMHVVPPGSDFASVTYRAADFAAYSRLMQSGMAKFLAEAPETYPEKVAHCEICAWWPDCEQRRRGDDHLSYVAGISSRHIKTLADHDVLTLADLADLEPVPEPETGSVESLIKVRDQARAQLAGRESGSPVHEVKTPFNGDHGFALLPEPTVDDIFLDFEGDHFAEDGVQEYLTGYVVRDASGEQVYTALWAETHAQEQQAFEDFIDFVTARLQTNPHLHIYHFAPYEQTALKKLMGRYATRGQELDELLRGQVFVDLLTVVKRSVIASVESYSIKNLEAHYGFERVQDLRQASVSRRVVETAIAGGDITEDLLAHKAIVEQYNRDDCVSMIHLQDWLEGLRAEAVAAGHDIARPEEAEKAPSEGLNDFEQKLQALRDALLVDVPADRGERSREQQARYTLAHILEFHRREDKATFWEKFRVLGLEADEVEDERRGVTGLNFVEVVEAKRAPVHRYTFAAQELDARRKDDVYDLQTGDKVGTITNISYAERTVDIKKKVATADDHPPAVVLHSYVKARVLQDSLIRLAESVIADGFNYQAPHETAINLLLVQPSPPEKPVVFSAAGESPLETACRLVKEMPGGVLAIQGPPGTGKTYTGGHMIAACIQAGLKVGVTAVSHEVIVNLLEETSEQAVKLGVGLSIVHKQTGDYDGQWDIVREDVYPNILDGLSDGSIDVVGATAWAWARADYTNAVDVLFIDEAGQLALGNALAVAQGGKTLVMLGDPQQLEQPTQGSHPETSAVSALEYLLDGEPTMPADRGMFLEKTYRLHPDIAAFTSEVYYEDRLTSIAGLENQAIVGSGTKSEIPVGFGVALGSGLRYLRVDHRGNTSKSFEEVDAIAAMVDALLAGDVLVRNKDGVEAGLRIDDILIVAPYNAQVAVLSERLPNLRHRIGTVNKFQGKGAPVVIYSMTSSSPEDAPRGMEFLYDPHRLNVATSRAKALCVLVGAAALFEPTCGTPQQMRMANGLCRYLEMARAEAT